MNTLLGFPNEILLHIIEKVDIDDIITFSSCCKFLDILGGTRRRRCKQKRAQYSSIVLGDVDRSSWSGESKGCRIYPILCLGELLSDEQNTLYPRTLYLGEVSDDESDESVDANEDEQIKLMISEVIEEYRDRIISKVHEVHESLSLGDSVDANKWARSILSGDQDAAVVLLIAILPRLQTLNILDPGNETWTTQLDRILQSSTVASFSRSTPLHSFGRLSELNVQGDGTDFNPSFGILAKSMLIPSMRRLKGSYIEGHDQPWPYEDGSSEVTEIDLDNCAIDSSSLSACLRGVRSLQSFKYTFNSCVSYTLSCLEPRGTLAALTNYCSKTLVHLFLNMERPEKYENFEDGEPFLDSLRSFEVLETIRLDSAMLFEKVEESRTSIQTRDQTIERLTSGAKNPDKGEKLAGIQRLVDFLPASAKTFGLLGGLSTEDAAGMFADLVELKEKRLPNLREVCLTDNDPLNQETKEACKPAGIRLSAWKTA